MRIDSCDDTIKDSWNIAGLSIRNLHMVKVKMKDYASNFMNWN